MKTLTLFILLILMLSCSKDDNQIDEPELEKGLVENQTINISGINRNYHLFIPSNPTNAPIVLLFHGNRSSYDQILGLNGEKAPYKVWLELAEAQNIILVVPNGTKEGTNPRGWNDCRTDADGNPTVDDVSFSRDLIDLVLSTYGADRDRVYAMGTSNGGQLVFRLAQELANKLKAIATIASALPVKSVCSNANVPISVLMMNGTMDPILPYSGGDMAGNRGEVLSVAESINYWTARNETDLSPEITILPDLDPDDNSNIAKYVFKNGINQTEINLYEIAGGGHTEPSIAQRYTSLIFLGFVGIQNGDIEMANEVWDFFKNK